jgi:hypothetical protein
LLEGLKIVHKQNDIYSEGNLAVTARNEAKGNKHYFRDLLISTVLKERYSTLRDVFKVRILEPVIRVDNCIYLPEIETEEQIYRSVKSIRQDFKNYYHRPINEEVLKRNLELLVDFDVIKQSGPHYYGNRELRKVMIEKKKEIGSINKALLARA